MSFVRHGYLLPALPAHLEEDFVAELWAAGTLGVVSTAEADGRVRLEAYFAAGEVGELDLAPWRRRGVEPAGEEAVPPTDWLARWRESVQPFAVGERFVLDPREPGQEPPAPPALPAPPAPPSDIPPGRRLLKLPARAAFGTGSHESTRLALELLEEVPVAGRRVLDVGTGTGVLALAAVALGAAWAAGYDLDPAAPFHARENARLNDLPGRWFAGRSDALRPVRWVDLALINALPEEVLPELPRLVALLRPGGEVLLSGILSERGDEVLARLAEMGLEERSRRTAGEWLGLRLARRVPPP